jgi:hypothetical protein
VEVLQVEELQVEELQVVVEAELQVLGVGELRVEEVELQVEEVELQVEVLQVEVLQVLQVGAVAELQVLGVGELRVEVQVVVRVEAGVVGDVHSQILLKRDFPSNQTSQVMAVEEAWIVYVENFADTLHKEITTLETHKTWRIHKCIIYLKI